MEKELCWYPVARCTLEKEKLALGCKCTCFSTETKGNYTTPYCRSWKQIKMLFWRDYYLIEVLTKPGKSIRIGSQQSGNLADLTAAIYTMPRVMHFRAKHCFLDYRGGQLSLDHHEPKSMWPCSLCTVALICRPVIQMPDQSLNAIL